MSSGGGGCCHGGIDFHGREIYVTTVLASAMRPLQLLRSR